MRLLAQEAAAPSVPGGAAAQVAFLIATLSGMIAAVTALAKVIKDFVADRNKPDDGSETDREAQSRVLRESIEALGDALQEAADERARREAAEADAAGWRDKYIRLLEGGRDQ